MIVLPCLVQYSRGCLAQWALLKSRIAYVIFVERGVRAGFWAGAPLRRARATETGSTMDLHAVALRSCKPSLNGAPGFGVLLRFGGRPVGSWQFIAHRAADGLSHILRGKNQKGRDTQEKS